MVTQNPSGIQNGFKPSLIIKPSPGRFGYHPAEVFHHPQVSQSPFAREPVTSGLLDAKGRPLHNSILTQAGEKIDATLERAKIASELLERASDGLDSDPYQAVALFDEARDMVTIGNPYTSLLRAHELLQAGDVEAAGREFKEARLVLEIDGETTSEMYNMAVLGEARYGEIDNTTFDALEMVRANYVGEECKLNYERFVRATAFLRIGNESAAEDALIALTQIDSPNDATTIQAWVAKADLYIAMGKRTTHDARKKYLTWARDILVEDVPRILDAMQASGADISGIKQVLAQLYVSSAEAFIRKEEYAALTLNYPSYARQVLEVLVERFSDQQVVSDAMSGDDDRFSHFAAGGKLKQPEPGSGAYLKAAAIEFVHNMKFPKRGDFWKLAVGGELLGILGGILLRRGEIDFYNALADGAKVAVLTVAGAKFYLGATAPETRQAFETGFTNKTKWEAVKMGTGEVLKLIGTYAFFGGALPGIGVLGNDGITSYLLAERSGSWGTLVGPGSAVSALTADGLDTARSIATHIYKDGTFSGGMANWWSDYRHTVPGIVMENSWRFWVKKYNYATGDMFPDLGRFLIRTFTDWSDPTTNLARLYKGLVGSYATAMMIRPYWREKLIDFEWKGVKWGKALQWAEIAMLPGAYWLAVDINVAAGVKWKHAWRIPFLGAFSQYRLQAMGGNRSLGDMDWSAYMRAMIIPTLYTGTGAEMIGSNLGENHPMNAMAHSQSLYDDFKISMWVQASLYPIGFLHAALVGSNVGEQAKIKLWKSWREETVGNLARQNAGWATLAGTFWSMAVQIFFQSWINTTWREASGAPMQRFNHIKKIAPPEYDQMVIDAMNKENQPVPAAKDLPGVISDNASPNDLVPAMAITRDINPAIQARIEGRVMADLEERAKALENVAAQAGARWDYWNWLKGKTVTERSPYILAFYMARKEKDAPFPTGFQDIYYRKIIFRTLMHPNTPKSQVKQYLRLLKIIARDLEPNRYVLRQNLLISTWAARNGPHGQLVEDFFAENGWLKEYYEVEDIEPPENWGYLSAHRWFKKNLKRSYISHDGMRDDQTTWLQRLGIAKRDRRSAK